MNRYAGWSPRLVDALLMSCIPVIIADDTMLPYSLYINWSSIVLRISEADASVPHRLAAMISRYDYDDVRAWQYRIRHMQVTLPSTSQQISLRDALTYLSSSSSQSSRVSAADVIISALAEKSRLFEPVHTQ
jgi:hypothetical protein